MRLRTLLRLRPRDHLLLLEATTLLALARLAVLLLPFRVISRRLGEEMAESPPDDDPRHGETLRRVTWALAAVSRRTPWRSKCLEQGIAGKMMLRARGIPSTLYMGVARLPGEGIEGHAWLRSGSRYVSGGAIRERFVVVSTFADGTAHR